MTDAVLTAQIRSIELQLAVLKAQVERSGERSRSVRSLGDLYGVLAGTGSSSEEDIERALFGVDEDCALDKTNTL